MRPKRILPIHRLVLFAAPLLCLLLVPVVHADDYREVYRSPFGTGRAVSVNTADGSCWAATGASVMHVAADGNVLSQSNGFREARSVSCNPTDGSCWVADTDHHEVVRLGSDGSELGRWGGFNRPTSVSVDRSNGSCWVACQGTRNEDTHVYEEACVAHLASDGVVLWRSYDFGAPWALSANPTDGSCWVGDPGWARVIHLAAHGSIMWIGEGPAYWGPGSTAVNATDGSCWVVDAYFRQVVHLGADGTELWRSGTLSAPGAVSVDEADGSCWVMSWDIPYERVHIAADGTELGRSEGPEGMASISVDPSDGSLWTVTRLSEVLHYSEGGSLISYSEYFSWLSMAVVNPNDSSVWVADAGQWRSTLAHLAADGTELFRDYSFNTPASISVNTSDDSIWLCAADGTVAHLAADGSQLYRGQDFISPMSVSANPNDGSCWVADVGHQGGYDYYEGAVAHLSSAGGEIARYTDVNAPTSVSVDTTDGSCWVADALNSRVVRLRPDCSVLLSVGGFDRPISLCVDQSDRSVWVADDDGWEVVHLSQAGEVLWRGGNLLYAHWVSVNPTDGSCWVVTNGEGPVTLFAADGMELWRDHDFLLASNVAVNPTDGSVWVTDTDNQQLVHLVPSRFRDVAFEHWAWAEIEACAEAEIVQGYPGGFYGPSNPVTRDQMAVYISRALVSPSGDAAIPDPEPPPSFADVPPDHWAYKHIEYAVSQNVVEGYDDGAYHPEYEVTRDQMAVYVARAMVAPGGDAAIPDPVPPATFPDVPSTFWSYKQVEYCVENGVVKGYDDGNYHPEIAVTRDQMAAYISRAFHLPPP